GFYAFVAYGTDRYPPFTLRDVPDYPARLVAVYPERQRRGLSFLGWWLLGLVQATIGAILLTAVHLVALLGALALLVRGDYPRDVLDFDVGLNRYAMRTFAFVGLLTPEYPPFRLDLGGTEAGDPAPVASPATRYSSPQRRSWSGGRLTGAVTACLLVLTGLAAIAGGATALVYDQWKRDGAGYLMSGSRTFSTDTYALVSDSYHAGTSGARGVERDVVGRFRVRAEGSGPIFVGLASSSAVDSYLAGVRQDRATTVYAGPEDFETRQGGAPTAPPTAKRIWVAQSQGSGPQTLTWQPQSGTWRIVVMRPDASRGVSADLAIGGRFPHLLWIGLGTVGGGLVLVLLGVAVGYAARPRRRPQEAVTDVRLERTAA
ncbi:MAG TPA: DUF4389 domain-containing protein, partial [Gaiella sp.]|nr:DUF4389 domain-containing protein [Gaiella sp.]